MLKHAAFVVAASALAVVQCAPPSRRFPCASPDGRYLVDSAGAPFFYHADSVWLLPKKATLAVAEEYFDRRVKDGFTAIQLHTVSKLEGPVSNVNGDEPFVPLDDILKPNEAYWRHLDAILEAAEKRRLFVAIAPLWIRYGGEDKEGWWYQLTEDNARPYGRFLGQRYAARKNILWIVGGDANPREKRKAVCLMAQGIKETAPHHLVTVHNEHGHSSAAFFAVEPWLDINAAYTYRETHDQILSEWWRPYPNQRPRPIFLIESRYEKEGDGEGTPFRVRRQAYGAVLSGSLMGHAYGHHELWAFTDRWHTGVEDVGSKQMRHVKGLFATRAWWKLEPDQRNELVPQGRGKPGEEGYVLAARASDGSFALIYLPQGGTVSADLRRLAGFVKASWFDPTGGSAMSIAGSPFRNDSVRKFTSPEKNAAGEKDWVLVLEAIQ